MTNTRLFNIVVFTLIANISFGQVDSTVDSISLFYGELIENLQRQYLHKDNVEWDLIERYVLDSALAAPDFESSLDFTSLLFDTIGCNHCLIFAPDGFYKGTPNKTLTQADFSRSFLGRYQEQQDFEVKLINDDIGYIQIPGLLMIDLSSDSLDIETQKMYDAVIELARKNQIKGWIVDLRFNTGGNVYPMLSSLHYLLGDNIMYKGLNAKRELVNTHKLVDGSFYSGSTLEVHIKTSLTPNREIPVAIIIGKITGSAGEDIAVAFMKRQNTIFIGENSYGYLTGNDLVELPFDSKLALTTCYIVDEDEVYREFIVPDITVSKKDNFEDLSKDQNVVEAIKYFDAIRE